MRALGRLDLIAVIVALLQTTAGLALVVLLWGSLPATLYLVFLTLEAAILIGRFAGRESARAYIDRELDEGRITMARTH